MHGRAREVADSLQILEIPISLSRTSETAVANAIAVTAETRPATQEKITPAQELALRFKEMRSMLDELEHKRDIRQGQDELDESDDDDE